MSQDLLQDSLQDAPDSSAESSLGDVYLYFENGLYLKAKHFGAKGSFVGEVVFNTSMTGYQEIITDPSYSGQFVVFSMPEIGIVGANEADVESKRGACVGIIIAHYNHFVSNFRSKTSLSEYLSAHNIIGICGIDTRALITLLRNEGAMQMIASTTHSNKAKLKAMLESNPRIEEINFIEDISTKKPYIHKQSIFDTKIFHYTKPKGKKAKIIALDFGIKANILNELVNVGLEVEVMPHSTTAQSIIERFNKGEIQGVFLSNGPGDPLMLTKEISEIKKLVNAAIPIFGICLGHQLLALAHGYVTYKLKYGHHGGNHPIKNLQSGLVEITAQNHNYCVPESIASIATITHRNLFDNTIEGLKYNDKPIFSIQYHPEASPGPREARALFASFAIMCAKQKR